MKHVEEYTQRLMGAYTYVDVEIMRQTLVEVYSAGMVDAAEMVYQNSPRSFRTPVEQHCLKLKQSIMAVASSLTPFTNKIMSEQKTKLVTVEGLWREYRDACYPQAKIKLDALQETETRQAFFAGCLVAAKVLVESSMGMDDDAACRNIKNFIDETQTVCNERVYELKGRN